MLPQPLKTIVMNKTKKKDITEIVHLQLIYLFLFKV